MKGTIALLGTILVLALAGTAGAALVPGVFDPGNTGCPVATFSAGVLHLEKNCPTPTNAAAQAEITGLSGQTFTSAAFTLKSAAQCLGGSPRFNIFTSDGTFFLGCNNVIPVVNGDGTATYTFTAATLLASGQQVPTPTGTITSAEVLIDVEGAADLTNISVNGTAEVPARSCPHHEGRLQEGRLEDVQRPEVQEPGPVRCLREPSQRARQGACEAREAGDAARPQEVSRACRGPGRTCAGPRQLAASLERLLGLRQFLCGAFRCDAVQGGLLLQDLRGFRCFACGILGRARLSCQRSCCGA